MTSSFMLHQLYIIRSQVELAIAAAEAVAVVDGPTACPHPADMCVSISNMGEPERFLCKSCKETVTVGL